MPALDCFVLSSKQEAFGRVLLEAMIAKLPIISTRTNGIPEVVGDSGIIVEPNNAGALAAEMKKIYLSSAEQQQENGNKAYQRAIDYFSIPCFQNTFWGLPLTQGLKE
jgi:glycosyltransferase involved in cell wall biosynthesis